MMKKADVLLGLQWGDEGKGKVVDVLAQQYDIVARFQGGPNAGHSLEINHIKHVLHTIPSGVFHPEIINIIGNGVVIDPVIFKKEIDSLQKLGVHLKNNLFISKKAHLILPSHRILDAASEAAKGETKIGSTLKGIGPTYMDKTGRNGIRAGDIFLDDFLERYHFLTEKHRQILKLYDYSYDLASLEQEWMEGIAWLKTFSLIEGEYRINEYLRQGKTVLAEGAQGTLLDIDFGSYPYVTSSNTVCAGACTGLGIPPTLIGEVYGIFKAYCTRVGSGPFPTELNDETGEYLRTHGKEFGSTTGRPRRCGWLDLPALKYAIMLNGVTKLIMTKTDVLNEMDNILVATAYRKNANTIDYLPFEINEPLQPVYKTFKGWKKEINKVTSIQNLPAELLDYIRFIEKETCIPIVMVSSGPERKQLAINS